ncbi:unnamed protein product [Chrysoparadoxa australica]
MPCDKCESKLTKADKVICPNPNSHLGGGKSDGKRAIGENMLLKHGAGKRRQNRNNPIARPCRICKSKLPEGHHYCQDCSYKKGICSMCGKKVADVSKHKMSQK